MKLVIVGGVAGGATAAARVRRLDENAEIIIFERSGHVSYANCGLPYYIGGVIADDKALTLQTPESFYRRFRVSVKTRHEVLAICPEKKTILVKNLESGETFEESYDKLLLSPGAKAVVPELPGVDSPGIFTLRTVEDTMSIRSYVLTHKPRSVVLVGGGFIGLELAENLRELGMEVTVVQRPKQLLRPFDPDMAAFIHEKLRQKGIHLALGRGVACFEQLGDGLRVQLQDGESLRADMVVLAVGVRPDSSLAKEAGLALGAKESIAVNDRMETSVKDIYAVGDAVELPHFVSGEPTLTNLAGPANRQGRIAADNICGLESRYDGSQGSAVVKLFDLTAACTGLSETAARKLGLSCESVILSPMSHAGYYPGAQPMTMKLVFEKGSLRILGAQIIGSEGVDKRIDVLATALRAKLSAAELVDLELAYAPPFSSAKDPVNLAGYMVENIAGGLVKQFHYEDVEKLPRDGSVQLLDARTPREYSMGYAEGFVNIPVDELRSRLDELDVSKPVYVMCQSGLRSYIACRILSGKGFDCYNFAGGYRFYRTVEADRKLLMP